MGKGDKSTRRGKISAGSYGIARPHKDKAAVVVAKVAKPAAKTASRKKA